MLQHFFGRAGKTPDQVTSQDVFAWAYGTGLSGKPPGSITIGARIACLSSFYRFLIRMKVVAANPCDALERPRYAREQAMTSPLLGEAVVEWCCEEFWLMTQTRTALNFSKCV